MNDLLLVVWGVVVVGGVFAILTIIDRFTKCNHAWGDWEFKEDSAVFIQKRHCTKCNYTEVEQHRKLKEIKHD